MYKKISAVAILLIGGLTLFTPRPQAMASPFSQSATATPVAEEEAATHDHSAAAENTSTEAEPTLEDLHHQLAALQAEVDEMKAELAGHQGADEASANEVTTAIYLLDTVGLHALDERLNSEQEIQAGDAGTVSRIARLLSAVNWPDAMASDAAKLIDMLDQLAAALGDDDLASAADLSTQVHEAQHEFSHSAEHWLADQSAPMANEAGQAFRVTSAVYLLDSAGLHDLSERLVNDMEIQAGDSGNVSRIAGLLSTVDWPDTLAEDAANLVTTLNDLSTALGNDDLETATPLADSAHEAQHDFSHAAEHWLAEAMGADGDSEAMPELSADEHSHDHAVESSDTITDTDVMSDTHTGG